MNRGEIWWATLSSPRASEPGYRHPVLIVQSDEFNRSRIRTVMAVVITSNLGLKEAPGNVYLPQYETGLPKDSVANVYIQNLATGKVKALTNYTNSNVLFPSFNIKGQVIARKFDEIVIVRHG